MKKQVAKILYVWLIRFYSFFLKPLKVKKKLVYLMSFPKNENGLLGTFIEQNPTIEVTLFYEKSCECEAAQFKKIGVTAYPIKKSLGFIKKAVPLFMQARVILCDNYFPILAGLSLQKETTVIQIWHANGAIKRFGLEDPATKARSSFDIKRFEQVYQQIDEYIVGSKMMGQVFQNSYNAVEESIVPIGYPRSDIYFEKNRIRQKREYFYKKFPELRGRKIILYAPTYREDKLGVYPLDIKHLYEELGNEYVLIMKKHPHIITPLVENHYESFFYDNVHDFSIEDLLVVTDCLITDYSSVPFEFTLLDNAKKIIFYCYDQDAYNQRTGIQRNFKEWAPGEIVSSMDGVIAAIKKENKIDFNQFNEKWNTYNDGHSKERVIKHIQKKYDYLLS
ncbi:CDP-glycerol glycerophosphotransferase, TagB/SpsB family [Carnobacterium iners]|uniref:CDP-glycerol glycerophosphotransferase, TagB/SpsB family n=1 Tax=Carnobacterium iners TaxID=1073423 RepID=A0A1X7N8C2_9LACT|nr:CDP-glycerol glycerophosphotransferase family protein [Carnobacterium iners]SEL18402.1 CDP-glycerol glycerophosphotransferase, TagB/SpsB family [Carnobacterium iners]SMH33753.1 CDP-glycerol glycerophosphotransferase, TagB/SpsB family [Carnobacterium iners]